MSFLSYRPIYDIVMHSQQDNWSIKENAPKQNGANTGLQTQQRQEMK